MHKNWKYYWPGYAMALPCTLIGLFVAIVFYRSRVWSYRNGVIECEAGERKDGTSRIWFQPSAQTWGNLIIYRDLAARLNPPLRVHERVHVWQFMTGGVFFAAAYGLHFAWRYVRDADHEALPARRQERWRRAYRGIFAEEQAYDRQARYAYGKWKNRWMV